MEWTDEDDRVDPAFAPLIEAGQGESEGFELAEEDLERHATSEQGSTNKILRDADGRDEDDPGSVYGEADEEMPPDA